ncbi:GNAT family N-acetyltransferase [Teredinibacter purpureus]|uniref:GNAT family N-acetyltransferase n=1 Tax=Teredinibacter purpureus TaxID=2731756 RepID=UPI0038B51E5F
MTAAAVVHFDDIHRADPYIEAWCDGEVAFIDMVYVPHEMRRKGIATTLVKD